MQNFELVVLNEQPENRPDVCLSLQERYGEFTQKLKGLQNTPCYLLQIIAMRR